MAVRAVRTPEACFAAAVVGDRVLVATDRGIVALFDPATGTCLLETNLALDQRREKLGCLIRDEGRQALFYTKTTLFLLDCETLATVGTFNGLRPRGSGQDFDLVAEAPGNAIQPIQINSGGLRVHADGTLIAGCTIRHDGTEAGTVSYGLVSFDLERKTALRQVAQQEESNVFGNGFQWFSPSRRRAIRFHYAAIPRHDGRGSWRYADIFSRMLGKGGRTELPDCKLDGVERLGIAVEVWQTKPLKPVAKLVVRMQPLETIWARPRDHGDLRDLAREMDFANSKPGDPFPFEVDLRLGIVIGTFWRLWLLRIMDVAWEEDESAFWLFLEQGLIRRVGLDGSVSPLYKPALFDRSRLGRRSGGAGADARGRRHVLQVIGPGRVRVNCLGDQILQLPPDPINVSGEEISVEAESWHPGVPLDIPLSTTLSQNLGYFTRTFIDLADLSQDSVIGAIDALTDRIAAKLSDMVWREGDRYFHVTFVTPTHMIGEPAFFDFVAERYADAAGPALRRLLVTFCRVPLSEPKDAFGFHYTEQVGALGDAMLALIQIDPDCADVLALYMNSSNVGQTQFVRDELLPAFREQIGWKDETAICLGVQFALYEAFAGSMGVHHSWEQHGLRYGARQVNPETFAMMILSKRQLRAREIDVREVVAAWTEVLTDDPFETAVRAQLLAHLQPKGAEGIVRLREAVAYIEAKSVHEEWTARMFRSLELDRFGRFNLSAREFGELIVASTQARAEAEGFDGRMAARVIRVLRGIASTFDRAHPYDAELLQILDQGCNDAVSRAQTYMNAR